MSTGGFIGAVFGGVVGFFIGGPVGAAIGAGIGMGVGMMIDPISPDVASPGAPQTGELAFTTAQEGLPVPDVMGSTKLTGNIFWYANNRVVEIRETQEAQGGGKGGGGGGSQEVVKGYKYYLTWAMGICLGPVDSLYTVFNGDDVVWSGVLSRPAFGGKETIVLSGLGSMTFYFGTADQIAESGITSYLDDATLNPAYRHFCYVFFDDCMIGDYNRAPQMKFVLRKSPSFAFNPLQTFGCYDYNPAHACWYLLTCMIGLSETYLDSALFSNVAFTLFDEERGIDVLVDRQVEALTLLESILKHIDGVLYWSIGGKLGLKLMRADQDVDDLPVVTEDDMLDDLQIDRGSWLDTLNEVKLQYPLRYDDVYTGEFGGGEIGNVQDYQQVEDDVSWEPVQIIKVTDGVVAITYSESGVYEIKTYSIDANGQITDTPLGTYSHASASFYPRIMHLAGPVYIVSYVTYPSGIDARFKISTVSITSEGAISLLDDKLRWDYPATRVRQVWGAGAYYCFWVQGWGQWYIHSIPISEQGMIGVLNPFTHTTLIDGAGDSVGMVHITESSQSVGRIAIVGNSLSYAAGNDVRVITYPVSVSGPVGPPNDTRILDSGVLSTYQQILNLSDDLYVISCGGTPGRLWLVRIGATGYISAILDQVDTPSGSTMPASLVRISEDTFIAARAVTGAVGVNMASYKVTDADEFSLVDQGPTKDVGNQDMCSARVNILAQVSNSSGDLTQQLRTHMFERGYQICEGGNFREAAVVSRDIANQKMVQRITPRTVKMGLFTKEVLASWAADRLLKEGSYPFARGSFPANRNVFRFEPGDPFVLNYTPYSLTGKVFRVVRIEEEAVESEEITIYIREDAWYSSSAATMEAVPSYGQALDISIEALLYTKAIEAPYVFAAEQMQIATIAARRTLTELGYLAHMSLDGTTFSKIGLVSSYCPHGLLVAGYTSGGYTVDDLVGFEVDFTNRDVDDIQSVGRADLFAGKNMALLGDELISFQTITPVSGLRYKITGVFRGRFDTEQVAHLVGASLFFLGEGNWGVFKNAQFLPGVARHFKYLPYNMRFGGTLDEAIDNSLSIGGRAYKPYRPTNMKVNGVGVKPTYDGTGDLAVAWAPRVRGEGVGVGDADTVVDAAPTWEGYFKIEAYHWELLKRTVESINDDEWTYTAAMNTTDGGPGSVITFKLSNYRDAGGVRYESAQTSIVARSTNPTVTTTTTTSTSTTSTSTTSTSTTTTSTT